MLAPLRLYLVPLALLALLPLLVLLAESSTSTAAPLSAPSVNVNVAWSSPPLRTVSTSATVEVDIMPFLSRTARNGGGNFTGYFEALQNLRSANVRFAPWFPYWQVAVLELQEPECGVGRRGSSWNSTLLDGVLADFMLAVCGQRAAQGECAGNRSVIPQLSTMPAWLYVNASNFSFVGDPWAFPRGFSEYEQTRRPLKDPSCRAMARYAARYVSWYTRGGMTDECGMWHESGLHYNWPILSVLNEDETQTPPEGGVEYTICFDAWQAEIRKINSEIVLMGPEATDGATWPGGDVLNYTLYFLNASHHADGVAPALVSNHHGDSASTGPPFSNFFSSCDTFINNIATPLDAARRAHAPHTELVMNEFVPVMNEWCELTSPNQHECPRWIRPPNGSQPAPSAGMKINRKTQGWNAAAANFAYGFGRFAQLGYKLVGLDQLVAGPYPDNFPSVAMLDWTTGQPNAKYYAVQMLASLGTGTKQLHNTDLTGPGAGASYALGMVVEGVRKLLLVSKSEQSQLVHVGNTTNLTVAMVLDGSIDGVTASAEPGFLPPVMRPVRDDGVLRLGPWGFALLTL